MEGKIFSNSANIFQDQAKILFDYYKQAAEKIISEEEKYEKEIAVCKESNTQVSQDLSKANLIRNISFGGAGLFVILGFVLFSNNLIIFVIGGIAAAVYGVVSLLKGKKLQEEINANDSKINEFQKTHKEIFRDYKVSKLGIGYVPIGAQIPFEDKNFIIDYTGAVNNQEFKLQTLRKSELFTDAVNSLDELLKEVPIVEGSTETEEIDTEDYSLSIQNITYHDYFGKLDRSLRTASFCLEDLDQTSVMLPVVVPNSEFSIFIKEHATSENVKAPIFEIFDGSQYNDEIERFHSLNEMKKSLEKNQNQFEEVLRALMINMANSVQAVTQVKMASTNLMVDSSNKLLYKILKNSYNHYSPSLEAEEIERIRNEKFNFQDSVENYQPFHLKQSSKLKYDILSDSWVAEDGSKTNYPFGVHQIQEEIVAPIVQNLMQETRLERLKIYNNIKDQKINYLNQWHRDTEDFYGRNRAESNDLINIMRSTLSEYIASYNAMVSLEKTEQEMESSATLDAGVVKKNNNEVEVLAAFDLKSKDFQNIQNDFMGYMERLKEDIDVRAAKYEHIEYYDASLRDGDFKNYAVATGRVQELDKRRMPLSAVNPFFAESSELPPAPSVEDLTHEHFSINLPKAVQSAMGNVDNASNSQTNVEEEQGN